MTLFVTGDFEPETILKTVEESIIKNEPFNEEIKRIYPDEPKQIASAYKEVSLCVAMPMFVIGFKDNAIGYDGEKLLKKIIETEIIIKMIFSKSSPLYEKLYNDGLITPNFGAEFSPQKDYAYTAIEGESKDPKKVYDIIIEYIDTLHKNGISRDDFIRAKKAVWGDYIRSYNDIEGFSHSFLTDSFLNINYFNYYDVYKNVNFDDAVKRFNEHFDKNYSALSVVNPVKN